MINLMFWLMLLVTVVTVYIFWVRPLLKKNPKLATLFATEDSYYAAFSAKFSGIKERLAHALLIMASAVVYVYDFVAPHVVGVDVTPLTSHIPSWAWPLICIGGLSLLDWFRAIADKQTLAPPPPPAPSAPEAPASPGE